MCGLQSEGSAHTHPPSKQKATFGNVAVASAMAGVQAVLVTRVQYVLTHYLRRALSSVGGLHSSHRNCSNPSRQQ